MYRKGGKGLENVKKIMFILVAAVLIMGCAGCGSQQEGLLFQESGAKAQTGSDGNASVAEADYGSVADHGPEEEGSSRADTKEASVPGGVPLIYVQVSGAVNKPGVYALPEGSRVFQAVELAGGLSEEADVKSLNQAQALTDGEMIWVMTAEEAKAQAVSGGNPPDVSASVDDGRVNLNTATKEELTTLPGIGEAKAGSILAWRETNGSFAQIEDLMKIEGIKEGVFSKIKDYVKVQ